MDELEPGRGTVRRRARCGLIGCAVWALCVGLVGLVGVAQAAPAATSKIGYAKVEHVCAPPAPGDATCFALVREPVSPADAAQPGVKPYAIGDGASKSGPAGGLTPAELASSYGYDSSAGGAGQTVAIVDAYDDPAIEADLANFDTQYGLASCTHANGCFTKVSQTGSEAFLPEADTSGWSVEIALDVDTVRAACQSCKILLVEAKSPSLANLAAAVNEAVGMKATEVSNSYGGPEGSLGSAELNAYDHPGVVIAAATGDDGYYDWTALNEGFIPPNRPNLPSTLPTVVSVGGTSLHIDEAGRRTSETVWNGNGAFDESELAEGAAGGGCSTMFTGQLWQRDTPGFLAAGCGSKRLAADVSAVADPLTGFDIYDSYNCGLACEEFKRGRSWLTIGGTSLATPLISALYGLAGGSGGVAYPALTLYGHLGEQSSLYDVTQGGNGICDDGGLACGFNAELTELAETPVIVDCEGTTACNATAGYDGPSGVGAPSSLSLFSPVQPTAAITAPHEPHAGSASSFSVGSSSDPFPGGSIDRYDWSWGDGSPDSSSAAPTHDYSSPGEYTVSLTVGDNYGQSSAAASVVIEVSKTVAEGGGGGVHAEQGPGGPGGPAVTPAQPSGSVGVAGFKLAAEPSPIARFASSSIHVGPSGSFTIELSCPAGRVSCAGTITLRALAAAPAGTGKTLASGRFDVGAGKTAKFTLHLSRSGRRALVKSRSLRARVALQTGTQQPVLSLVTLHASHRH
jgi:hypothetical protein